MSDKTGALMITNRHIVSFNLIEFRRVFTTIWMQLSQRIWYRQYGPERNVPDWRFNIFYQKRMRIWGRYCGSLFTLNCIENKWPEEVKSDRGGRQSRIVVLFFHSRNILTMRKWMRKHFFFVKFPTSSSSSSSVAFKWNDNEKCASQLEWMMVPQSTWVYYVMQVFFCCCMSSISFNIWLTPSHKYTRAKKCDSIRLLLYQLLCQI